MPWNEMQVEKLCLTEAAATLPWLRGPGSADLRPL